MKNKKVLFLVTSLNSGGIENYLIRYLNYDRDVDAYIWCKGGMGGELEDSYLKRVKAENIIKKKIGFINVFSFIWFILFCRKNKFDGICDFTGEFGGMMMLLSYVAGVKSRVVFYRNSTLMFKPTRLNLLYAKFVNLLVYKFATKILSNSQAAFDFYFASLKGKLDSRFEVIYNGLNSSQFDIPDMKEEVRERLGIPHNAFVIGHTGRFHPAKNHETIIKVATELCRRDKNIYFVIVGKGTDINLKSIVKENNLTEQIKLLGYRDDVNVLLKCFDIFYFPSLTEGQPNSLLEAMVSGLPVVASNIPSIIESVPKHKKEFLIEPQDVNLAVATLYHYYINRDKMEQITYQDWAKNNYAMNNLFEKFKNNI